MSNEESENTASPVQLGEVEQAWETIRRFVVDWRIRDNNHSLGPTLALVQEQHDEARANLEDAEKEVHIWHRNFNVAMRERDEARADYERVCKERDEARAEMETRARDHLAGGKDQGVVAHLIKERDDLRENLAQVRRDSADLLDANDRLRRERDVLSSRLALIQKQHDEVREERDQARKTRGELTLAVATLAAHLRTLRQAGSGR